MASHAEMLTDESLEDALSSLADLYRYQGTPAEFWQECIDIMSHIVGATAGQVALWGETNGEESGNWRIVCGSPAKGHESQHRLLAGISHELADTSSNDGFAIRPIPTRKSEFGIGVKFVFEETHNNCVALFLLVAVSEEQVREVIARLRLMANLPDIYQSTRALVEARNDIEKFAGALDLMVLVNAEDRFLGAALTTCNELTTRFHCDRVSLGWSASNYIKVKAISRTEKFERKANVINALELAMEECLEQNEEIIFPEPPGVRYVSRDHETFARAQGVDNICSVPLRVESGPVAVLTFERNATPFTEIEAAQLRLCADQSARRLDDLHRLDRWFGARWIAALKRQMQSLIGVEHTWAKLLAILVVIALAVLFFGKVEYRVEAPFVLESEDIMYVPAPFDGYIERVDVKVGDIVKADDPLLTFDSRDMIFQKTALLADQSRYLREMQKARADNAPAERLIAEAQLQQTNANLSLTRHRLAQAGVVAPFDGVVVEGDLRERIGAPINQGEILFKIAKLENLYVELAVDERDKHELTETGSGEIAFASQPKLKFSIRVERIEPVAEVRDGGNVFPVRATFVGPLETWYRPGMTGVGKLTVGKRRLIWIFTHETIDFLRMLLWW
jgi:hypothetical protein